MTSRRLGNLSLISPPHATRVRHRRRLQKRQCPLLQYSSCRYLRTNLYSILWIVQHNFINHITPWSHVSIWRTIRFSSLLIRPIRVGEPSRFPHSCSLPSAAVPSLQEDHWQVEAAPSEGQSGRRKLQRANPNTSPRHWSCRSGCANTALTDQAGGAGRGQRSHRGAEGRRKT